MTWTLEGEPALVDRAKQADEAAFADLMAHYERPIYSFIIRMMADPDEAADLTQDTFVKAYRGIRAINGDLNVSAWLHRIATNACLDVLRRRQRLRWLPWDDLKHDHLLLSSRIDDPDTATLAHEAREAVWRTLHRMSSRHRLALVLREYEGLSCVEIGEVMNGLSRSAVKSMLFRAREEFRRLYAADTRAPAMVDQHRQPGDRTTDDRLARAS